MITIYQKENIYLLKIANILNGKLIIKRWKIIILNNNEFQTLFDCWSCAGATTFCAWSLSAGGLWACCPVPEHINGSIYWVRGLNVHINGSIYWVCGLNVHINGSIYWVCGLNVFHFICCAHFFATKNVYNKWNIYWTNEI